MTVIIMMLVLLQNTVYEETSDDFEEKGFISIDLNARRASWHNLIYALERTLGKYDYT